MAVHAGAAVAKVALDRVGHCLGALLLAAVWTAEFSLLLRPGEFFYRSGSVDGESAHRVLAGDRLVAISISLHHRLSRGLDHRQAHHWRHGIYGRSRHSAAGAAAEFVSRRDASTFIVGDLADGFETLTTWIVVPINYCWRPELDINWARGPFFREQHVVPGPIYLLAYLILVPAVVYFPTHVFLAWLAHKWNSPNQRFGPESC